MPFPSFSSCPEAELEGAGFYLHGVLLQTGASVSLWAQWDLLMLELGTEVQNENDRVKGV